MTYYEIHKKLVDDISAKADGLHKLSKELDLESFGLIKNMPKYKEAYNEWEIARNKYSDFLLKIRGKKINLSDEADFVI